MVWGNIYSPGIEAKPDGWKANNLLRPAGGRKGETGDWEYVGSGSSRRDFFQEREKSEKREEKKERKTKID